MLFESSLIRINWNSNSLQSGFRSFYRFAMQIFIWISMLLQCAKLIKIRINVVNFIWHHHSNLRTEMECWPVHMYVLRQHLNNQRYPLVHIRLGTKNHRRFGNSNKIVEHCRKINVHWIYIAVDIQIWRPHSNQNPYLFEQKSVSCASTTNGK